MVQRRPDGFWGVRVGSKVQTFFIQPPTKPPRQASPPSNPRAPSKHPPPYAPTLFTPTRSPGFSAAASTSPTTGRKMVWRVEVLRTTHLPFLGGLGCGEVGWWALGGSYCWGGVVGVWRVEVLRTTHLPFGVEVGEGVLGGSWGVGGWVGRGLARGPSTCLFWGWLGGRCLGWLGGSVRGEGVWGRGRASGGGLGASSSERVEV